MFQWLQFHEVIVIKKRYQPLSWHKNPVGIELLIDRLEQNGAVENKTGTIWRQWWRSVSFIVNVEHISYLVSVVNFEHVIAGW